jgi:hypothetical protein
MESDHLGRRLLRNSNAFTVGDGNPHNANALTYGHHATNPEPDRNRPSGNTDTDTVGITLRNSCYVRKPSGDHY